MRVRERANKWVEWSMGDCDDILPKIFHETRL